jgi:N-acyl amino acid synthase of PEP-CTERM/exosortase system
MVTFGLFLSLVRLSAINDITHWVAVMEPSLLRLLARFGIKFTPIGGLLEYHGMRQPCFGSVDDVLDGIRNAEIDLWHLITDNEVPLNLKGYASKSRAPANKLVNPEVTVKSPGKSAGALY